MTLSLTQIKSSLQDGLLSFPITDFDDQGNFKPDTFANRIEWFVQHKVSSVFVAGGTGEFFSLSKSEYEQVVKIAVEVVNDRVPVIAGAGKSIPDAIEFASIAEKAGAHGLLLFPPYLTECPADGAYEYGRAIMNGTKLPVIYYNRANGMLTAPLVEKLASECENFIGLKDGTGNIQDLNDIIRTTGDQLSYIGGFPTAEIIAEAYLAIGVNTYSSAAFNIVPDLANHFYKSLRVGDIETVEKITRSFFIPLVRLRQKKKGYAVSLIKAGAKIIGKSGGDVRAPLVMPGSEDTRELQRIIEEANAALGFK